MKRNSSMFDSSNSFVFEEKFTSVGDSSQNLSTTSSEDLETRQLEEEFNYVYKLRELEEEFKNNERTINEIQKETEKLKKEIELQEKEKDSVEEQLENEFETVKELKKQVEKLEQIEMADYAHDKLLEREIEKKIKEIEDEEEKVDSKIDDLKFEMENLQDKKQELQSRELEIRIKALEEGTNVIRIPEKVNEQKETDSKEKIIEKLLDKQEMLGRIKEMKETHRYVSNSEIILPVFQEISRLMSNINDYNKIENVNNLISKLSSSVTKLETFSQFYNKNVPELTNELFLVHDQVTTEFEIGNNIGNLREQTVVNNSNRTNLQIMEERKQLNQLETIQKQELRQMNQELKKLSREKSKLKTQQYEMSLKKEESKMKRSKIQRKQQDLDRKELVIDKLRVKFKKIQKEIFILNQKEQSLKNQQKKLEEKQSQLKREANNIKKDYQKKKNQF